MNIEVLNKRAERYYEFNATGRPYHNMVHADRVASEALNLLDAAGPGFFTSENIDLLLLAAIWHDAVYVPGALNDANEHCSRAALMYEARDLVRNDADRLLVTQAGWLIMRTTVDNHLRTGLAGSTVEGCLLDADLMSLAEPFGSFLGKQHAIITEQGGEAQTRDANDKCCFFLENLASRREFIYHTKFARNTKEREARENIKAYREHINANCG